MKSYYVAVIFLASAGPVFTQTPQDRLRTLVHQAQVAEQQERLDDAASAYREILRIRPHWPSAELNLGLIHHSRKEYSKAIALLSEALRHDPTLHSAVLFRGASYHQLGQYQNAVRDLEQYLEHEPNSEEALSYLGSTHVERGDFARGALAYARLAVAAPSETALFHLSDCYLQAARIAMKRLSEEPEAKYFFLLLSAEDLLPAGQRDLARSQVQEAIQINPGAPEAHTVLRRLKDSGAAASCEVPDDALLSRAHCAARQGNVAAATKELVAIEGRATLAPRTIYWSFQTYKQLAQVTVVRLAQLAPSSPWLSLVQAQLAEQNGRDQQADHEYRRAISTPGAEFESHVRYAKFLSKQGQLDRAIPLYERALSFEPDNARVMALIGEVHVTQNRPEKALPYLQTVLRSHIGETQSRLYLAQSLIQLQRASEAIAVLEAAPEDPDGRIHYLLGRTLQQQGQPEKAREAMSIFRQRRAGVK